MGPLASSCRLSHPCASLLHDCPAPVSSVRTTARSDLPLPFSTGWVVFATWSLAPYHPCGPGEIWPQDDRPGAQVRERDRRRRDREWSRPLRQGLAPCPSCRRPHADSSPLTRVEAAAVTPPGHAAVGVAHKVRAVTAGRIAVSPLDEDELVAIERQADVADPGAVRELAP
jgi:hypothetical protein